MKSKSGRNFCKSIMGGFFIALGALGFVLTPSLALGSFVFMTGIVLSIVTNKLLFSSTVAQGVEKGNLDLGSAMTVLLGNTLGSALFAVIIRFLPTINLQVTEKVTEFMTKNLAQGYWHIILLGMVAGILTASSYLAGKVLKKQSNNLPALIGLITPVIIFCLGGFEYVAASAYYLVTTLMAGVFSPLTVLLTLVYITLGNFIGSAFIGLMERVCNENEKDN